MTHKNITLRVPVELVERLDAEVASEAARTGLRIDRSQIIRKLLAQSLPELTRAIRRKAAK